MEKFKFSLAIIALIFFLPNSSGEIHITANGESNIIFVDSGQNVTFNAIGTENTTSILWDFGRDINGPDTRYSNLTEIEHAVHASGRYNITLTANYENDDSIVKELVLIVSYEESFEEGFEESFEENIVHSEALFFAIAATEIIMSLGLGYWTSLIKKEKVYLWRLLTAIIESKKVETNNDNEDSPVSSSKESVELVLSLFPPPELLPSSPTFTVGP